MLPHAGNLLTAVGAIAGGPVGAAIGAAANAVLKKPLGQLAAKTYRVTGPWKEPKVEVISRERRSAASAIAPRHPRPTIRRRLIATAIASHPASASLDHATASDP